MQLERILNTPRRVLFGATFLLTQALFSQNTKIDSIISRAWSLSSSKPSVALSEFDKSYLLAKNSGYLEGVTESLRGKSSIHYNQGSYILEMGELEEFLTIKTMQKDTFGIIDGNLSLAAGLKELDRVDKAVNHIKLALNLSEQKNDDVGLAYSYMNLGSLFANIDLKKSREYSRKDSTITRLLLKQDSTKYLDKYSQTIQNIGFTFHKTNPELAFKYYNESKKIALKSNNKFRLADLNIDIALIHQKNKDYSNAKKYFLKALNLNKSINNLEGYAQGLIDFAGLNMEKLQFAVALDKLDEADTLSKNLNNLNLQVEIYDKKVDIYKQQNILDKAFEFQTKKFDLENRLKTLKSNKQINELEINYSTKKKEQENSLLKQETKIQKAKLRNNRLYLGGALGFGGVLSVFSFLLYNMYKKKKQANILLEEQTLLANNKTEELTQNLIVAKHHQDAKLHSKEDLDSMLGDHFIFSRAKHIVSGDFYYVTEKDNKLYFAVCDATGHGVAASYLTMDATHFIDAAIKIHNKDKPNEIWDYVRTKMSKLIYSKRGDEFRDGFDGVLCVLDKKTNVIEYVAANNQPYLVRKNEDGETKLFALPKDRMSVSFDGFCEPFNCYKQDIQKGDTIYLFSDGFPDQFGGKNGRKLRYPSFKKILTKLSKEPLNLQEFYLGRTLDFWQGDYFQVDDIMIMGVKF